MSDTIRVAVIGCGGLGRRQAQIASESPNAELIGVCDTVLESAQTAAEQFGAPLATDDYQALLDEKPDAVHVVTPTFTHAEIVVAAAEAGIHVFCEKPMATSVSDCERMTAACAANDVRLMIGYVLRFRNGYRDIKRLIDEGRIGEVRMAYAVRMGGQPPAGVGNWRRERAKFGGLYSASCHQMDLLLWYAGPVTRVKACVNYGTFADTDAEDTHIITWEHASGAVGSLHSSQVFPVGGAALGVGGTEGAVKLEGDKVLWADHAGNTESFEVEANDALTEQLEHFYECVRTGVEPLIPGAAGRDSLEIFEAGYLSGETGDTINLPMS